MATERFGIEFDPFHPEKLLRSGMSDYDLKELRDRLTESVCQVLRRCHKEGFVSETRLEKYAEELDLDFQELKRKKGP